MFRAAVRRSATHSKAAKRFFVVDETAFGKHLFKGAVAEKYLQKHGLSASVLDNPSWTSNGSADAVAAAVLDWARDHKAAVCTHWFQPLAAAGVREGQTGQVHTCMVNFGPDGTPIWELEGKTLLKGETDGSSFPNGGLRATHTAGGYTILDPSSPIFLRGMQAHCDNIFRQLIMPFKISS
eukprot:EG_transcript_24268